MYFDPRGPITGAHTRVRNASVAPTVLNRETVHTGTAGHVLARGLDSTTPTSDHAATSADKTSRAFEPRSAPAAHIGAWHGPYGPRTGRLARQSREACRSRLAAVRVIVWLFALLLLHATTASAQGWYNGSWKFRKKITIDHAKVGSTGAPHANYPVLVNLSSDAAIAAGARSDGFDILFTSTDGTTKLNHEIETYTSGTGALVAWVNVPSLSSVADTDIYLYYGNASASDQQNVSGTWESNFKGVWHLNSVFTDSTSNNNDGTNTGTISATGKISTARGFVRSNGADYITVTGKMGSPVDITLSAWANLTTRDTGRASSCQAAFSRPMAVSSGRSSRTSTAITSRTAANSGFPVSA